jgi:isochorismate synthase
LAAALQALRAAVEAVPAQFGGTARGLVRLEVPVPRSVKALWWLRGQGDAAETASLLHPRVYFSPRRSSAPDTPGSQAAAAASAGAGSVAGAGAAWLWRGPPGAAVDEAAVASMQRFLASGPPRVRVFGGARFSAARAPAPEWEPFGAYYFVLPRVEYTEAAGCGLLACNVAWDADLDPADAGAAGFPSLAAAAADALAALAAVRPPAAPCAGAINLRRGPAVHSPDAQGWAARLDAVHEQLQPAVVAAAEPAAAAAAAAAGPASTLSPDAALNEFLRNGQQGLDQLLAALDGGFEAVDPGAPGDGALTKVVLARRSDVALAGRLEPLELLEALQERDPRAYQVALQLPSGQTFVASTPERLYARTGDAVASEAVAGTRARGAGGDVEKDFWLAFDLLRSPKDHVEFGVVRAWVERALRGVCEDVVVEVSKSVLKQGSVQHLYGRLAGRLRAGRGDAQLLAALHPTPAVCGQPRGAARDLVEAAEPFDRGFYAGPFGWLSDGAAEFAVAIRSALVQPGGGGGGGGGGGSGGKEGTTAVSLYAGVGIVSGSDTASEWAELDLKVAQYERLLAAAPPLAGAPNVGALRAAVVVEELCRRGCNTFCVAPGERAACSRAQGCPPPPLLPLASRRTLERHATPPQFARFLTRALSRPSHPPTPPHRLPVLPADGGHRGAPPRPRRPLHRRALAGLLGAGPRPRLRPPRRGGHVLGHRRRQPAARRGGGLPVQRPHAAAHRRPPRRAARHRRQPDHRPGGHLRRLRARPQGPPAALGPPPRGGGAGVGGGGGGARRRRGAPPPGAGAPQLPV